MDTEQRRADVGRLGARFGPYSSGRNGKVDAPEPAAPGAGGDDPGVQFDTIVRGYDRRQVDEFVQRQSRTESELQARLATAERRLQDVTAQAAAEIQRLRAQLASAEQSSSSEGFGARAEKLLRLAEAEAVEIRTSASRESSTLIDQARLAAEQRRHESEQVIIARARTLDEENRRRTNELDEREGKIAEQLTAGRAELERLHAETADAAGALRDEALAEAELITERARTEAARTGERARAELDRVAALRADVYAELERLEGVLTRELSTEPAG